MSKFHFLNHGKCCKNKRVGPTLGFRLLRGGGRLAWVMLLWWVVGRHKGMSRPKVGKVHVHVHVGTL